MTVKFHSDIQLLSAAKKKKKKIKIVSVIQQSPENYLGQVMSASKINQLQNISGLMTTTVVVI